MPCHPDAPIGDDVVRRPGADAAARPRALGRVIVVDRWGRADAVEQQIDEHRGQVVAVTASVTDALLAASKPSAVDAVVVAFCGVDRFADDWAGPRLIGRLRTRTATTVVAAVRPGDVDGAAFAIRAGAHLTLSSSGIDRSHLATAREPGGPEAFADFEAWFSRRYSRAWQPWMIDAASAIASGSDRGSQADWCQSVWRLRTEAAAERRLRELRASLCGEVRDETSLERSRALDVLRRYGQQTAVAREPELVRSLSQASCALQSSTALWSRLLTREEQADLIEVAAAERELSRRDPREGPGRPPRGAWRARRDYALGMVAARSASRLDLKVARQRELEAGVQDSMLLIHDALDDGAADGVETPE